MSISHAAVAEPVKNVVPYEAKMGPHRFLSGLLRVLCATSFVFSLFASGAAQEMFTARPTLNFTILRQSKVLKELGLSDEVKEKVPSLISKCEENSRIEINGGGSPEEIQDQIQEQMRAGEKRSRALIRALLTEDQYKRFDQLSYQSLGIDALMAREVLDSLKLTSDQRSLLSTKLDVVHTMERDLFSTASETRDDGQVIFHLSPEQDKKWKEDRKAALDAVVATFTDEQKLAWREIIGPDFEFEKVPPSAG